MINTLDQALDLLKKESDPLKKICSSSCYWIPLWWLYEELKKNKDIVSIKDLDEETKKGYWKLVCQERPDRGKATRVFMVQAIHAFQTVKTSS